MPLHRCGELTTCARQISCLRVWTCESAGVPCSCNMASHLASGPQNIKNLRSTLASAGARLAQPPLQG